MPDAGCRTPERTQGITSTWGPWCALLSFAERKAPLSSAVRGSPHPTPSAFLDTSDALVMNKSTLIASEAETLLPPTPPEPGTPP